MAKVNIAGSFRGPDILLVELANIHFILLLQNSKTMDGTRIPSVITLAIRHTLVYGKTTKYAVIIVDLIWVMCLPLIWEVQENGNESIVSA